MKTNQDTRAERHAIGEAASAYLDALRALGANLVIVSHVLALYLGIGDSFAFGNLGVTVFFLLSGFLIMQSMLNRSQRPEPRLPGFLADRVARIMTPYVPALVLIVAADLLLVRGRYGADGLSSGIVAFAGNLFMLQDHSVFQLLDVAGADLPWRIRAYNTAEPFWTVSIEMWIYIAMGLFFFCIVGGERVHRRRAIALALASLPVFVWNAAAGGGKSLSLIWLLGALAGLLFYLWQSRAFANVRAVSHAAIAFGGIALIGRAGKAGFHPYDFQTAALLATLMFGVLARLLCVQTVAPVFRRTVARLASYSYSLYLIHNTVLILVVELAPVRNPWLRVALGVVLAHVSAYLLYLGFERHYRLVSQRLRPTFERWLAPSGSRPADARAGGAAAPRSGIADLADLTVSRSLPAGRRER